MLITSHNPFWMGKKPGVCTNQPIFSLLEKTSRSIPVPVNSPWFPLLENRFTSTDLIDPGTKKHRMRYSKLLHTAGAWPGTRLAAGCMAQWAQCMADIIMAWTRSRSRKHDRKLWRLTWRNICQPLGSSLLSASACLKPSKSDRWAQGRVHQLSLRIQRISSVTMATERWIDVYTCVLHVLVCYLTN